MERLMSDGYPFIFQLIDKSESDEYLIQTLQYRFKSDKSHHAYIVRVECYKKHAYCVKFFDKANINSKNKFSLRSNTFEARTILYTMFHIMLDVLKRDKKASFFFIGAEDEKDQDGRYPVVSVFIVVLYFQRFLMTSSSILEEMIYLCTYL